MTDYGDAMFRDERPHSMIPQSFRQAKSAPNPFVARLAARILKGPLSAVLITLGVLQLLTWLPHYLTWPYWADHDVFATAARAWSQGKAPYRDTVGNNFPGTIYLFVVLGQVAGWKNPAALYAFDAGLLLGVLGLLIAWSRVRFLSALPGVTGGLMLLGYYLSLDYSHAAQRDWHGPALMVAAILMVQWRSGRSPCLASALAAATATTIRPQSVLFLPALGMALFETGQSRRVFEWLMGFAVGLMLALAPLAWSGVLGEFVRSLRLTTYGGPYNKVTPGSFFQAWLVQASSWRWWSVASGIVLLGAPFVSKRSRTALPWLVAMLGVSLYKPLSPVAHSYLDTPLVVVWSVTIACFVGIVLDAPGLRPEWRLAAVMLTLGLGNSTLRPEFCRVGPSIRAVSGWLGGSVPEEPPPGYRRGSVPTSAYYDWKDYRVSLDYLRQATTRRTRIANVLKGDPAVTSMVDRPSVFPAESVAWLRMVRPEDEPRFARALEDASDSVVVWVPGEVGPDPSFKLEVLTSVIRRLYHPEARFGVIEIWRRSPE